MAQLIIEQPGVPPMTVDLSEDEIGFGRAETNQIILVAEEVSRNHAKILLQGDKTILEDLKSLNGTYVNRQRIVQRVLTDNDEIMFGGKCKAIFRDDSEEVKAQRRQEGSAPGLVKDLDQIREEMDRVATNMTMIGMASPGAKTIAGKTSDEEGQLEVMKMSRAFRRLDALYKATKLIASDFDLEKRMSDILDLAMDVTNAGRGFLMMREEETDNLTVRVAREMGQELSGSSPSTGIARHAAIDGQPVLMADSGADQQFGMRESIIRQRILSAMCVPLKVEDRILGSLYVDSSKANVQFTEEDLELFQAMANQSAMAIENVRLYEQMLEAERKRSDLGRFLSPSIVDHIMNENTKLELGGQIRVVTTMFCDIRGFTALSTRVSPGQLVDLLNDHFTAMTDIVFEYNGTLDKYNGDEVMALFGAPIGAEGDAKQAVRAAIAMQAKIAEMNKERESKGLETFETGIGVNTGEVIVGYVGSPSRMDFTVMGDNVNVASRFCSLAKRGQIVTGESTYELVKDDVDIRPMGGQTLKNIEGDVLAFEVIGPKS